MIAKHQALVDKMDKDYSARDHIIDMLETNLKSMKAYMHRIKDVEYKRRYHASLEEFLVLSKIFKITSEV